jgi:hypothetical protein
MNLMSPTNSLMNNIAANSVQPTPAVGMGATELCWTDRHAYTITEVSPSGRRITVRRDHAKRTDSRGMSECQHYDYSPNPQGSTRVVTLRSNGRWVTLGESAKGGTAWHLDRRAEYHDYSF